MKEAKSFAPYLNGILNALFERAIQFAVIDDVDLDRLPNEPHVLIYPDRSMRLEGGPNQASIARHGRGRPLPDRRLHTTFRSGGDRQTEFFKLWRGSAGWPIIRPGAKFPSCR